MAAYLIFVEGVKRSDTEGLTKELGIENIERGGSGLMWSQVQDGPSGAAGLLGGWMQDSLQPMYKPNVQQWRKAPGGKFWVGTWNEWPLKPGDVARNDMPGRSYPIKLEDGNEWLIPVARWLPHLWGMDDEGKSRRVPAPAYVEFCKQAEDVFQEFCRTARGEAPTLTADWEFVCEAMAINYRLAPPIISVLGLVGDSCGATILSATVEWAWIEAVESEKKNAELATADGTPST